MVLRSLYILSTSISFQWFTAPATSFLVVICFRIRDHERDFILQIRSSNPATGPLSTEELKKRVISELETAIASYERTKAQRPHEGDFSVILEWVMLTRSVYEAQA